MPLIPTLPAAARRPRRGLTLIEAAMVLAVVTLVFGGFAQLLSDASDNLRARNAADRLKEVAKAAELYVSANQKVIREKAGANWTAIAVVGAGANGLGLASVRESGYLPTTYQDSNAYNQGHVLYVRTQDPVWPLTARRIEAVVTTVPAKANARIPWRQLGRVASMVGAQGGFCRGAGPTDTACADVLGANGGWKIANAATIGATAGTVQAALFTSDTGVVSDYLNRNNIGDPEANTMRATITSSPPPDGPYPGYAMYLDPKTGQTELKLGPNVAVPGYIKAGDCATPAAGGDLVACRDVKAGNDVTAGRDVNADGQVKAQRFVDANDGTRIVDPSKRTNLRNLNITDMLVTTSEPGDRLFDNNEDNPTSTVRLRDLLPRYVAKDGYVASSANPDVELPVCPNGGQQRIFLQPMQDSFAFDLAKYVKPQISPNYVYNVNGGNPATDNAVTNVRCDPSGACTQTKKAFVVSDGLTYNQGVTDIGVGQLKYYRQFVAGTPQLKPAPDGSMKYFWSVALRSPANDGVNNADPEPLPWQALAMTYCYY